MVLGLAATKVPFIVALINLFILSLDQMITCYVKGVGHSDEPTEKRIII